MSDIDRSFDTDTTDATAVTGVLPTHSDSVFPQAAYLYTHGFRSEDPYSALTIHLAKLGLGGQGSDAYEPPQKAGMSFHDKHEHFEAWFYKHIATIAKVDNSFAMKPQRGVYEPQDMFKVPIELVKQMAGSTKYAVRIWGDDHCRQSDMWYLDIVQQVESRASPNGLQRWAPVPQRLPGFYLRRVGRPGTDGVEELFSCEQSAGEAVNTIEENWCIPAGEICQLDLDGMKPLLFRLPLRHIDLGDTLSSRTPIAIGRVEHIQLDKDQAQYLSLLGV